MDEWKPAIYFQTKKYLLDDFLPNRSLCRVCHCVVPWTVRYQSRREVCKNCRHLLWPFTTFSLHCATTIGSKPFWSCIRTFFKGCFQRFQFRLQLIKAQKDLRRKPGFDPITFTFSENSNYWRESLLEVVTQSIDGWCQQTFENKKFVDNAQQCFAFTPQANFPGHNLSFHWRWRWWDWIQATF